MDANIQSRIESYIELLNTLKDRTNEIAAVQLLQEISKDVRMEQIREEREAKKAEPATEKQKQFMKKLGIKFPEKVTKAESSALIDEELGKT